MVDSACRRLLQLTWKWSWGDLKMTQWHGPTQSLHFGFKATCNQAEYETLLIGLRFAKEVGAQRVWSESDSKIAAKQINKVF